MKIPHKIKNTDYMQILRFFDCYETLEHYFNIDISCGDGLFLPDICDDREKLNKYDGNVDMSLVRDRKTKKMVAGDFWLTFKYNDSYMHTGEPEFSQCIIKGGNVIDETKQQLDEANKEIERLKKQLNIKS